MKLIHPAQRGRRAHLIEGEGTAVKDGEKALCGYAVDWHAYWTVVRSTHGPLCRHCARVAGKQAAEGVMKTTEN